MEDKLNTDINDTHRNLNIFTNKKIVNRYLISTYI